MESGTRWRFIAIEVMPASANLRTHNSAIGTRPPSGKAGLAMIAEMGSSRLAMPAASMQTPTFGDWAASGRDRAYSGGISTGMFEPSACDAARIHGAWLAV